MLVQYVNLLYNFQNKIAIEFRPLPIMNIPSLSTVAPHITCGQIPKHSSLFDQCVTVMSPWLTTTKYQFKVSVQYK